MAPFQTLYVEVQPMSYEGTICIFYFLFFILAQWAVSLFISKQGFYL